MSNGVRLLLIFLAACCTALAAADPFGLPTWVQVVAGVLATGFAAIGIPAAAPVGAAYERRRQVK